MGDPTIQPTGLGANGLPVVPNVQTTSPTNTTTTPIATPEYQRTIEEQRQAYQNEGQAIQQGTDAKVLSAQKQSDLYSGNLDKDQEYLRQRQIADDAATKRIEDQRRQSEYDERMARIAANPTSYWDDRTAGERTQARIGVWLGVLGGALKQSDNNVALDYLNKQIEIDTKNKAARAERLMKLAEHSTGVLSEAYRQRAEDLADKDAQRKVGWDVVGKQVEAATMASQVPQAQAQGAQLLAQVQAKGAEAEQAARAKIMATTTHEGQKVVTTQAISKAGEVAPRGTQDVAIAAKWEEQAKLADKLNELIAGGKLPTPEQVSDITNNANAVVARKAAEEHSPVQVVWGRLLRKAGALPDSIYPKDMDAETKEAWRIHTLLGHTQSIAEAGTGFLGNTSTTEAIFGPRVATQGDDADMIRKKFQNTADFTLTTAKRVAEVSRAGMAERRFGDSMYGSPKGQQAPAPMSDLERFRKARAILADPSADPAMKASAKKDRDEIAAKVKAQ